MYLLSNLIIKTNTNTEASRDFELHNTSVITVVCLPNLNHKQEDKNMTKFIFSNRINLIIAYRQLNTLSFIWESFFIVVKTGVSQQQTFLQQHCMFLFSLYRFTSWWTKVPQDNQKNNSNVYSNGFPFMLQQKHLYSQTLPHENCHPFFKILQFCIAATQTFFIDLQVVFLFLFSVIVLLIKTRWNQSSRL